MGEESQEKILNYYTLMYDSLPNKICYVECKLEENSSKLQEIADRQEDQDWLFIWHEIKFAHYEMTLVAVGEHYFSIVVGSWKVWGTGTRSKIPVPDRKSVV